MAADLSSQALRRSEILTRHKKRIDAIANCSSAHESRWALARLILIVASLAGVSGAWSAWGASALPREQLLLWLSVTIALLASAALVFIHRHVAARSQLWTGIAASAAQSLARLKRDSTLLAARTNPWSRNVSSPPGHPYAHDLDICERVFPLLDTCATPKGSQLLLNQLLTAGVNPPSDEERSLRVRRASALAHKTPLLRRLEAFRLSTANIAAHVEERAPGESPHRPLPQAMRILAAAGGVIAWLAWPFPAFLGFLRGGEGEALMRSLMWYALVPLAGAALFRGVVIQAEGLLRSTRASRPFLRELAPIRHHPDFQHFTCFEQNARRELHLLALALDLVSVRNNPVLWLVLHAVLPWDSLASLFLLIMERRTSTALPTWNDELAELDVLAAIGRFAAENPHSRFPTCTSSSQTLRLTDAVHPLLSPAYAIPNSLHLHHPGEMVLLTGSNMSGKSTFLRTLGTNLLLHNMGAPIFAKELESPPRRVLCAIRVDDSLADGTSYFYAEVKRLKSILDELARCHREGLSSLFLVDEIFRGTNNRERLIGSRAVLHALMATGQAGVVSTHDLALTELEASEERLRNYHFREHISEGKLIFDYQMRPGPCPTTNALHIMREAGLPVPESDRQPE